VVFFLRLCILKQSLSLDFTLGNRESNLGAPSDEYDG